MGVQIQRSIDASFQSLVYDKVEPVKMLDLITFDLPVEQLRVCLLDPIGGQAGYLSGIIRFNLPTRSQ